MALPRVGNMVYITFTTPLESFKYLSKYGISDTFPNELLVGNMNVSPSDTHHTLTPIQARNQNELTMLRTSEDLLRHGMLSLLHQSTSRVYLSGVTYIAEPRPSPYSEGTCYSKSKDQDRLLAR